MGKMGNLERIMGKKEIREKYTETVKCMEKVNRE